MRSRFAMSCFIIMGVLAFSAACISPLTPTPGGRPPTRTPEALQPTRTESGPGLPTRLPGPTATEESGTGMIAGDLSYPSEWIPALRVVAFDANTMVVAAMLDTQEHDSVYTLSLPVGAYYVVAYTMDGMLAGGYTQSVPCGLTVACADHSLIAVQVLANMSMPNIDPGDWYAPPGSFPPMPGSSPMP